MTNVIIGGIPGFYIYFCRSTTWKSGTPDADTQQPFNPITEATGIRLPQRIYDLLAPVSSLYPVLEVDKNLEPTTVTFRCYFRDPFLMLAMFTHKELPSSWSGTSDTITGNFSDIDDVDNNIAVQLRLPDPTGGSNHVDLLFDGGKIVEYRWIGEESGAVIEEIDIKFAEISENTEAIDIDDGFDDGAFDGSGNDGGWALWDGDTFSSAKEVLLTKDVTIEIGGVAPSGLQIQSWQLTIPIPVAMEFVASSQVAGIIYEEVRGPYELELNGKLSGNQEISEAISTLASKTKATAKLEYSPSPLNKYFQFTNAVLKEIDGLSIPKAGATVDVTYRYEGAGSSVLTYIWTGSETTDPSSFVKHSAI